MLTIKNLSDSFDQDSDSVEIDSVDSLEISNKAKDESSKSLGFVRYTDCPDTSSSESRMLSNYIKKVMAMPMLEVEEEKGLFQKYWIDQDVDAFQLIVKSHLKLVVKIAYKYKGYGLSLMDVISEGNLGLMKAVQKFSPDFGRLSGYAAWWIDAQIKEFILKSWSVVKVGTSSLQKKMFFSLAKIKRKLGIFDSNSLTNGQVESISKELGVNTREVMDFVSSGTKSVLDQENEYLVDYFDSQRSSQNPFDKALEKSRESAWRVFIEKIASAFDERKKYIFYERILSEEPRTLEEISKKLGISKERVRQIEKNMLSFIRENFSHDYLSLKSI